MTDSQEKEQKRAKANMWTSPEVSELSFVQESLQDFCREVSTVEDKICMTWRDEPKCHHLLLALLLPNTIRSNPTETRSLERRRRRRAFRVVTYETSQINFLRVGTSACRYSVVIAYDEFVGRQHFCFETKRILIGWQIIGIIVLNIYQHHSILQKYRQLNPSKCWVTTM